MVVDRTEDSVADLDVQNSGPDRVNGSGHVKPDPARRSKLYFGTWLYRERNLIERFFSKLKHFRRVAT